MVAEAQLYQPLLKEANEWHLTNCYTGCFTDIYVAADDTIINGKTYKILDGYHYISREFLLREDVASRKVFFLFIQNGKPESEILLYDFSLSVGDSMHFFNPISPFPSDPGYFTLDSIKPLPLNDGSITKKFYWSANDTVKAGVTNAVWIEGSGSQSLINAPGGFPDINQVGKLSCHFKTGILAYTDLDSISECAETYNLSKKELYGSETELKIYPNPASTELIIHSTEGISTIEIFHLDGRLIDNMELKNSKDPIHLDLSELPPSVLIVHIIDSFGKSHYQKISKD